MASPSPPKPWEHGAARNTSSVLSSTPGVTPAPGNSAPTATTTATATAPFSSTTSNTNAPELPSKPESLNSVVNRTASNYSPYSQNRFGASTYGSSPYGSSPYGYSGLSSYSSPYSRFGTGYGSMYGGYGGMGGMHGGMGGMYGGYGGMGGMGGMGMAQDPNNPQSLTQSFSQSTQATFQIIESIVGAFGGFAQMLESTYMATHSSFFAMVSVAEQFGNLRNTLGSVLGIFTLLRWLRSAIAKLTGRPPPASSKELTPSKFAAFNGTMPDGSSAPPRPSKKPFIMFMVAVFGLPYLMGKLIRALAASQEEEERKRLESNPYGDNASQEPADPSKLQFCRVMYDFTPETQPGGQGAVQGVDLAVKKGDLVAVLSKSDPLGNASEWWLCRSRDGRRGYLPSPYLEVVQRRQPAQIQGGSQAGSQAGSRAQTMSGTGSDPGSRLHTMKTEKPEVTSKAGDISVESFQKGGFYS